MLHINLLAVKAAKRHVNARQELLVVFAIWIATGVGLYLFHWRITSHIDDLQARLGSVKQEIGQLKQDVVRVEDFKKKAEEKEQKLAAIDKLEKMRFGPAKVLDQIATILTEHNKVWLTRMAEKDGTLTMNGGAMEHEDISDFELAIERTPQFFSNVKLGPVRSVVKDGVTFHEWSLSCKADYAGG